jgi:uncharacterized protein
MACNLLDRALVHAVTTDDLDAARTLLEQGADVNVRTPEGLTLLMWAAAAGRTTVVQLLIQEGADLAQRDRWGQTALMKAAQEGHRDVVQLLNQAGAAQ